MRRSTPPLQFLAAMSNRQFSNQRSGLGRGMAYSNGGYVTGDEHFQSVHELNLSIREKEGRGGYNHPTSSAIYNNQRHHHYQNRRLGAKPSSYTSKRMFRPPQWDYRVWEYSKTAPSLDAERFVVLSYNILADSLGNEHREKLYRHIPRYMMDWEWRKRSILFELGLWSPDIMCFQEVDRFEDFDGALQQRGYRGVWKMRTGSAVDGCAVFWRTSRFNLIQEKSIEFRNFGLRDNVAQICVLEMIPNHKNSNTPARLTTTEKVVVCNIHVLYNPKRGELKLGQVRLLMEEALATSKLWNDAPLVICGDFNSTPKSALYNYIAEQEFNIGEVDRDKVSGQASATINNYTFLANNSTMRMNPCGTIESYQKSPTANNGQNALATELRNHTFPEPGRETSFSEKVLSGDHGQNVVDKFTSSQTSPLQPEFSKVIDTEPEGRDMLNSAQTMDVYSQSIDNMASEVETTVYNPYLWTPAEIKAATGDEQCTLLKHHLFLTSTYTEVEDGSRTRDSNGEPLATSCNRCFLGTVDYIWRSEGLQTVRVLAPLSKQSMQESGGFPTKKWGSDHIALVAELALIGSTGGVEEQ